MSGKSNVNPNHYKLAGRERQGEDILHEQEKRQLRVDGAARRRGGSANFIPGAAPVGEAPLRREPQPERRTERKARPIASSKQRAAARKAATAAKRKQTLKKLPKRTRIALDKEAAKARRRTAA